MQLLLRLVANTFGYIGIEPIHCSVLGICLSEERNACCRKIHQNIRENIENILYIMMDTHDMMKRIMS